MAMFSIINARTVIPLIRQLLLPAKALRFNVKRTLAIPGFRTSGIVLTSMIALSTLVVPMAIVSTGS